MHDRQTLQLQLKTQIANQASWVFVLVNAGAAAALIAWTRDLPLLAGPDSCEFLMLRTLPIMAAVLLCGTFIAVISYILRYRAIAQGSGDAPWLVALVLAGLCPVVAGSVTTYVGLNCSSIAWDQKVGVDLTRSLQAFDAASEDQRSESWDRLRTSTLRNHITLQLSGPETELEELEQQERQLQRLDELKRELARRLPEAGPLLAARIEESISTLKKLEDEIRAERRR